MSRRRPKILVSIGNLKVGTDTIIMNITSATDCPSRRRGLCQIPPGACYALRDEKRYKKKDWEGRTTGPLVYRRRQNKIWDALTAEEIAEDVKALARRSRGIPIRYLRMQESGDFRSANDLAKLSRIADLLKGVVTVYTYTARRDLFPHSHSSNLIINGSGFMVDNNFKVVNADQLGPGPKCRGIAGGGCYGCYLCKTKSGKAIQEALRGSKKRITPRGDGKGGVPLPSSHIGGDLLAEDGIVEVNRGIRRSAPHKKAEPKRRNRRAIDALGGLR